MRASRDMGTAWPYVDAVQVFILCCPCITGSGPREETGCTTSPRNICLVRRTPTSPDFQLQGRRSDVCRLSELKYLDGTTAEYGSYSIGKYNFDYVCMYKSPESTYLHAFHHQQLTVGFEEAIEWNREYLTAC